MQQRLKRAGWVFIVPITLFLLLLLIYPMIYSFYLSLTSTKGIVTNFVGLNNFKRMIKDPMFFLALKNTFRLFLIQVPIMLGIALILATVLNDKKLKFRGFFRTAIFLPAVTSLISYTVLFKMLFAYDGVINGALMKIGIISAPLEWLTKPKLALVVLIVAMIWRWTGYNMVFYLSAMQNISSEIYEAAEVDGANKLQTFFKITVPSLKPMILFTAIMSTIGTVQLFDEPMNLSHSGVTSATVGPANVFLTLSVYIYNVSFKYTPNFGYAASLSYAVMIIIAALTIIQFKLSEDKDIRLNRKLDRATRKLGRGDK